MSDTMTSIGNVMDIRDSPIEGKEITVDTMQFLEFMLGHEFFAINLFHTREVIIPNEIIPMPGASSFIKGMMDLRGTITTIVDLKKLMNIISNSTFKQRSRIIILDNDISEKPLGILVDDVSSVSTYRSSDIEKGTKGSDNVRYISGVIRKPLKSGKKEGDGLIIWLDISAMMKSLQDDL